MTPDEYLKKAIDLGFRAGRGESNAFAETFGTSEKTRIVPGKPPIADDDDRDDSDSDAAEVLHEPEAELIGDDTVVDVDGVVPQGNDAA